MSPESDFRKYLRPDVVSRLSQLDLIARLVVEGFITGLHRSPYHGFSAEFSEYRPYMTGDSTRHIDWKVWGRTDRYYIKAFEEETNLKSYLILDTSGSMGYTSHTMTKLTYASYLAAALAYLMLKQRDSVGLVTFAENILSFQPPRSIPGYLSILLKTLDLAESGKETALSPVLHTLSERIKRRGLILLFSDLLDNQEHVLTALKHFRHRKHEVIVFHILDPEERQFSFQKESIFEDMETREKIQTQPWNIRKEYHEKMSEFIEYYKRECRSQRIDYVPIDTSQPFDAALFHYLALRKRIGG